MYIVLVINLVIYKMYVHITQNNYKNILNLYIHIIRNIFMYILLEISHMRIIYLSLKISKKLLKMCKFAASAKKELKVFSI